MVASFLLKEGTPQDSQCLAAGDEDCVFMMAGSNMKGFVLAVGLFLLSWLTPLLQKAFYARAITLLLSCAGLCIVVPPHVWEVLMSCW